MTEPFIFEYCMNFKDLDWTPHGRCPIIHIISALGVSFHNFLLYEWDQFDFSDLFCWELLSMLFPLLYARSCFWKALWWHFAGWCACWIMQECCCTKSQPRNHYCRRLYWIGSVFQISFNSPFSKWLHCFLVLLPVTSIFVLTAWLIIGQGS